MPQGKSWWKRRPAPTAQESAEMRLDLILAISQAVASSLDFEQVLQTVHQQVSRIFDTANFYIATYEPRTDEWIMVFQVEHGVRQPPARRKVSAGLTGYIIRHRRPLVMHNSGEITAFLEQQGIALIGELALSWMGVPLVADDQVVGVMAVQSYERENLYAEAELALFSTIATQVTLTIRNARLYHEAQRRAEELALLREVNDTLGQALGLRETMEGLIQGLRRLIPHDAGQVCLYDPERKLLTSAATLGESAASTAAEEYTLEEGYTGWIGRNRRPLLIEECATFSEARPKKEDAIQSGLLSSYLGVPMFFGEQFVGTLELASSRPAAFDQSHLRLLTLVGAQAAAAVERARLFDELSRRLEQTRLLFQIGQQISSALSLDEVLESILRACLGSIPSAEKGSLHLLDQEEQELRIRAAVGYSQEVITTVRLKAGQGPAGRVLGSGEALLVTDAHRELRDFRVGLAEVEEIRSMACVPIRLRDHTVGVIAVDNLHAAGAFHPKDLEILMAFAGQAATAIANAGLQEQLRSQVERLRHLAGQVFRASTEARELVQTSAEATRALEEHSRAIGRFVAQVGQFADQTDLLALNAAIEAARAGAHGAGFAVVADEVRRLAESSAEATAEIAALSQRIIAETRQAGQIMERALKAVEQTSALARGSVEPV